MTNRLTRIYTKTGDDGTTAVANNLRVSKISPLIEAIGSVDEANSAIGMAVSVYDIKPSIRAILDRVQQDLFDLGAELSGSKNIQITEAKIQFLEETMDRINEWLEPLTSFILPRGPNGAGLMHNARAVVRRAERNVWMAIEIHENNDDMQFSRLIPQYLNRLSDLLFVLARFVGHTKNEILWKVENEK